MYNTTTTDTTVTVTVYSGVQIDKSISATFTGTQTATGYSSKSGSVHLTFSSGATNQTGTMVSTQTYSWARVAGSSSTKTITSTAKSTESGFRGDTVTATLTVTVPALPTYTITYNANGGSGAPSNQTKTHGVNITLATPSSMTRTGYTFVRWNTNASGSGTNYNAGATYTANANLTLYAVWQINTYQVTYNANGGTGSITNQTKTYGTNLTLSNGAGFTKDLYDLDHWNTASDDSGTSYALSATYSTNAALTLYAIWSLAYVKPTITGFKCYRVASSGSTTETDNGTVIYVTFDWTGGDAGSGAINPTCDITIGGTSVHSAVITTTPFQGWYTGYSADSAYAVSVKLSDSTYPTGVTVNTTINTATYPIDLIGSGTDVYMGVMTPAVSGQELTLVGGAIVDGDFFVGIDTTAASGTTDGDLYAAITALGWASDVIE